jgi:hypothetical protein
MAYKMFNKKFEEITIENPAWEYLWVTDYEDFVEKNSDWILDGVENDGIYEYDNDIEEWKELTDKNSFIYKTIMERVSSEVGGIKKVTLNSTFKGWNIIITLDTGETIKTNSEPVEMSEVQEAINIMLKPSFFGKRIKKFEIVAE